MRAGSAIAKFCFVQLYDVDDLGDDADERLSFSRFCRLKSHARIRSLTFDIELFDDSGIPVEELSLVHLDDKNSFRNAPKAGKVEEPVEECNDGRRTIPDTSKCW